MAAKQNFLGVALWWRNASAVLRLDYGILVLYEVHGVHFLGFVSIAFVNSVGFAIDKDPLRHFLMVIPVL